ncbi:hypothetical protein [Paeniglutamicibacter sulfureus]|uniref:Uncharacterized protein n=1 Tax=Paeniglutamicibacter sulfureus TaxID=43666 RepID=A0ABU2BMV8_9MICC|nr:hypothetical protein [Paeniglutamicibacter sulfureus]MDR7359979.1 hypothetical protein [Paeniglutamicibacter sulfureus]
MKNSVTAASLLLAGTPAVTAAPAARVATETAFAIPSEYDVEGKIESIASPAWTSNPDLDGWVFAGDTVTAVANIPEGATATYEWFEGKDGIAVATGVTTQTYTTPLISRHIMVRIQITAADGTVAEQLGVSWVHRASVSTGTYEFENKPVIGERLYWKVTPVPGTPEWAAPTSYQSELFRDLFQNVGHPRYEGNGRFSALVGLDLGGKEIKAWVYGVSDPANPYFGYNGAATGPGLVVPHGKPRQGKVNLPATIRVGDRVLASTGPGWAPIFVAGAVALTIDGETYQNDSIEWDYEAKDLGKTVTYEILQFNEPANHWVSILKKSYKVGHGIMPAPNLKIGSTGKLDTRTAKVGTRIYANLHGGKLLPGQKVTYQWLRDGKPIAGATRRVYVLAAADYGKTVSFKTTITAPAYITKTATLKIGTKVTVAPSKPGKVTVAGTRRPGKTVKAVVSSWAPGSKLNYQWLRNGKAIKAATKSSYKLAKADASKNVSVKVTAKRHAYTTISKTSYTVKIAKK